MSWANLTAHQPAYAQTIRTETGGGTHGSAWTQAAGGGASYGVSAQPVSYSGTGPASAPGYAAHHGYAGAHSAYGDGPGPYTPAPEPAYAEPLVAYCPEEGLQLTTLALGEEDGGGSGCVTTGGGYSSGGYSSGGYDAGGASDGVYAHASDLAGSYDAGSHGGAASSMSGGDHPGYEVTTLAIGEEDGGGSDASGSYGSGYDSYEPQPMGGRYAVHDAQPADHAGYGQAAYGQSAYQQSTYDHSAYGHSAYGQSAYGQGMGYSASYDAAAPGHGGGLRPGYGSMQPIYSPGEREYDAYARGSTGAALLNHTYVAPDPRPDPEPASIRARHAAAAPAQAPASAPVHAPSYAPAPGGDYVDVGDYDAYVSGGAFSGGAVSGAATTPSHDPSPAGMSGDLPEHMITTLALGEEDGAY